MIQMGQNIGLSQYSGCGRSIAANCLRVVDLAESWSAVGRGKGTVGSWVASSDKN